MFSWLNYSQLTSPNLVLSLWMRNVPPLPPIGSYILAGHPQLVKLSEKVLELLRMCSLAREGSSLGMTVSSPSCLLTHTIRTKSDLQLPVPHFCMCVPFLASPGLHEKRCCLSDRSILCIKYMFPCPRRTWSPEVLVETCKLPSCFSSSSHTGKQLSHQMFSLDPFHSFALTRGAPRCIISLPVYSLWFRGWLEPTWSGLWGPGMLLSSHTCLSAIHLKCIP